jgi:hypothetical protein
MGETALVVFRNTEDYTALCLNVGIDGFDGNALFDCERILFLGPEARVDKLLVNNNIISGLRSIWCDHEPSANAILLREASSEDGAQSVFKLVPVIEVVSDLDG